jgi:hypothetical protein
LYEWPKQVLVDVTDNTPHPHGSQTDAMVVVFTKDSLGRLEQSLPTLIPGDVSTLVLDDSQSSRTRDWIRRWPNVIYHGKNEQSDLMPAIDYVGLAEFISPLGDRAWRLGQLRNYALLLGSMMGKNRLLMIDDDIVIEDQHLMGRTLSLLNRFPIVGANTIGMPDFSVTGHIESSLGDSPLTFISGQYMAVDLKVVRWSFPAMYNEDWIFALLHAIGRPVGRYGAVRQLEYDMTSGVLNRAISQEPGELICEGVAELLLEGLKECQLKSEQFWLDILEYRRDLLGNFQAHVAKGTWMETTLRALIRLCSDTSNSDILKIMSAYLADQPSWRRGYTLLRERMTRDRS